MAPSILLVAPSPKAISLLLLRNYIVRVLVSRILAFKLFTLLDLEYLYKVDNLTKNAVLKDSCLRDKVLVDLIFYQPEDDFCVIGVTISKGVGCRETWVYGIYLLLCSI